jgi:hypothetical protein
LLNGSSESISPGELLLFWSQFNQSGFVANLVESFFCESLDPMPTTTPYQSGIPIDSIASSTDDNVSPAQIQCKEAYQKFIGFFWMAYNDDTS